MNKRPVRIATRLFTPEVAAAAFRLRVLADSFVGTMLELPPEWRRENRWILSVIRAFWPELLLVPINNLGPIREAFRSLQRVIRKPSLVTRRLKRRFG